MSLNTNQEEEQRLTKSKPKTKRNRRSEMCVYEGCAKRASFNLPVPAGSTGKNKPRYCGDHRTPEMINVRCKVCVHPQCNRFPSFGYTERKWCKTHRPKNAVNLSRSHCCLFEGCSKFPCWGDRILLKKRYCKAHALEGMVNVDAVNRLKRNKKMLQENPLYRNSTTALEKSKHKIKTLTLEKRYLRREVKTLRDMLFKLNESYKKDIKKMNGQNYSDGHHEVANGTLIGESSWKLIKRVDNLMSDGFSDDNIITTSHGSTPTSGTSNLSPTTTVNNNGSNDNNLDANTHPDDDGNDNDDDNVMTDGRRTISIKRKRSKDINHTDADALSKAFNIPAELQETESETTSAGASNGNHNNANKIQRKNSLGNNDRNDKDVSPNVLNITEELQQIGSRATNEDATNDNCNSNANKKQKTSSLENNINEDDIENDHLLEDGETLFL